MFLYIIKLEKITVLYFNSFTFMSLKVGNYRGTYLN